MKVTVFNGQGASVGEMDLPKVFETPMNRDLLHQVVTSQAANQRSGTAATRGRGDVRGGGKKPWRQKGTGRARHGSIRSPIWKGGGTTHGPNPEKDFSKKINKKMAKKALAIALGAKARDGELVVLEDLIVPSGKTKEAAGIIKALAGNKTLKGIEHRSKLVLLPDGAVGESRSFRNIKETEVHPVTGITALSVMAHSFVVLPKKAIEALEKRIS